MAVSNMNLIWTLVSQLHVAQALACGSRGGSGGVYCGDSGGPNT